MLLKYEEESEQAREDAQESGVNENAEDNELVNYGIEIGLPELLTEFLIEEDNLNISKKAQKVIMGKKRDKNWFKKLI